MAAPCFTLNPTVFTPLFFLQATVHVGSLCSRPSGVAGRFSAHLSIGHTRPFVHIVVQLLVFRLFWSKACLITSSLRHARAAHETLNHSHFYVNLILFVPCAVTKVAHEHQQMHTTYVKLQITDILNSPECFTDKSLSFVLLSWVGVAQSV
jgi:hypothetical protein